MTAQWLQSALDPKGPKAEAIAHFHWALVTVVTIIYIVVIATLFYVLRRASRRPVTLNHDSAADERELDRRMTYWVSGAVAATVLILIAFVFVDVSTARTLSRVGGLKPLRIDVVGHQWWWEVKYPDPEPHNVTETANEIHVPVGKPVIMFVSSKDVIHSLKIIAMRVCQDAIPGLRIPCWFVPKQVGRYQINCAQLCGNGHAAMTGGFLVVQTEDDYKKWLKSKSGADTSFE